MGYSVTVPFAEKVQTVATFLTDNSNDLVEDLKDAFYPSMRNSLRHSGFYRNAFDTAIEMRMRDSLRRTFTGHCDLSVEEGLVIAQEKPVLDVMNLIIERSLYGTNEVRS